MEEFKVSVISNSRIYDSSSEIKYQNDFMRWHDRHVNLDYRFKNKSVKYVNDLISDADIAKWQPDKTVVISCQTGKGKTTFISSVLLQQVDELNKRKPGKNYRIMILSNRTALSSQLKKEIAEVMCREYGDADSTQLLKDDIPQLWDRESTFGFVDILSYQSITVEKLEQYANNNYYYIIMDEAHFFTSDSTFNPNTSEILKAIIKNFSNAIRIYMTATPDIVYRAISPYEFDALQEYDKMKRDAAIQHNDRYKNHILIRSMTKGKYHEDVTNTLNNELRPVPKVRDKLDIVMYDIERDYGYIDGIYMFTHTREESKYDDLVSRILANYKKEKWLIFVSSKNEGNLLKNKINEACKDNGKDEAVAAFISSEEKESSCYGEIIRNAKFSVRVLIATSVIDNGINIKDSAVKNIVIDVYNRVEFLQMLGRLRMTSPEQKVKLYVFERTEKDLIRQLKGMQSMLIDRVELDMANGAPSKVLDLARKSVAYGMDQDRGVYYSQCSLDEIVSAIFDIRRSLRQEKKDTLYFPDYELSCDTKAKLARCKKFCQNKADYQRIYEALQLKRDYQRELDNANRRGLSSPYVYRDENSLPMMLLKIRLARIQSEIKVLDDRGEVADELKDKEKRIQYLIDSLEYVPPQRLLAKEYGDVGSINAEYAHWLELYPDRIQIIKPCSKDTSSLEEPVLPEEKPIPCPEISDQDKAILDAAINRDEAEKQLTLDDNEASGTYEPKVKEWVDKHAFTKEDINDGIQANGNPFQILSTRLHANSCLSLYNTMKKSLTCIGNNKIKLYKLTTTSNKAGMVVRYIILRIE